MDFTNQYPFPGGQQQSYHQFMPVPPLTPSHSHSAPSDDYNNSPPVCPVYFRSRKQIRCHRPALLPVALLVLFPHYLSSRATPRLT